jgi:hypothetical protein
VSSREISPKASIQTHQELRHHSHSIKLNAEKKMRVAPQSYRLYKTLYAFAVNRLSETLPGKISMMWLSFSSGYILMWVMHRMGESDERKESEGLKRLEEIERMLEKARRLRAAATKHQRWMDEAEKEEMRLLERVEELYRQRELEEETRKGHDRSRWFS